MSGFMPWDSVVDLIKDGIDKIWPDKTKADEARAALEQAQLAGALQEMNAQWDNAKAQLMVNQQEAGSASLFVAGWRPFIGWMCGSAFAYTFVLQPVLVMLFAATGHPVNKDILANLDFSQIQPVLYGMLGLGAMRTYEKVKGSAPSTHA